MGNADDTVGCGLPYKIQVFSTLFTPILCSQTSDPDGQKVASTFNGAIYAYANQPATYAPAEKPSDCANWDNADKSGLGTGFNSPVKGSTNKFSKTSNFESN